MMSRMGLLVVAAVVLCTSAGCWDRVEIDERGFVVAVAIDMPKERQTEERARREAPDKSRGKRRLAITYQMIVPAGMGYSGGKSASGGGGGQGQQQAFFNITTEEDTILAANSKIGSRTSRAPFFEHLKMVIISDEVAQSVGIASVIDYFLRDNESRRSVKLLISAGNARKVLDMKPHIEQLPAQFIESTSRNQRYIARMPPETRFGDVQEHLLRQESFAVQRIVSNGTESTIAGAAVFSGPDKQFVGFLGEEETEGFNFLTGDLRRGMLEVPLEDNLMAYKIQRMEHRVEADVSNPERIRFTVKIKAEGAVNETLESMDFLRNETYRSLEKLVEAEIRRIMQDTVRKLQQDFQCDAIGMGRWLHQDHYRVWQQVKNDWERGERYFTRCVIEVEPQALIRRTGTIEQFEQGDST